MKNGLDSLGAAGMPARTATTTSTTSPFAWRVPRQFRKLLPAFMACVIFVLYLSTAGSFDGPSSQSLQSSSSSFSSSSSSTAAQKGSDNININKKHLYTDHFSHESSTVAEGGFPRKIWQTWKVDVLDFGERDLACARTWTVKNPEHRYEVLTDQNALYYVETHFGPLGLDRPDIVHTFRELAAPIVKADLLRYLVMYVEGGVYSDIDVEALKPVDRFIPDRFDQKEIDMVVGVEVDEPEFRTHPILGPKSQSFCQWTFMCKPRLPVMMRLIDGIVRWLDDIASRQNVPLAQVELDFDDVISGTGPSAFTEAILAEMAAETGVADVPWGTFHNMLESKLIGGFLVLTVEAFAAGQGHSDSGNHGSKAALAKHHYHASGWPATHRRYRHPVYGEVERCNWDHECVRDWDEKTKAFEALSDEEKSRRIAAKEVADAFKLSATETEDERRLRAQKMLPKEEQQQPAPV